MSKHTAKIKTKPNEDMINNLGAKLDDVSTAVKWWNLWLSNELDFTFDDKKTEGDINVLFKRMLNMSEEMYTFYLLSTIRIHRTYVDGMLMLIKKNYKF